METSVKSKYYLDKHFVYWLGLLKFVLTDLWQKKYLIFSKLKGKTVFVKGLLNQLGPIITLRKEFVKNSLPLSILHTETHIQKTNLGYNSKD